MSIAICGVVHMKCHDTEDEIMLAFDFEKIANTLSIGTRLGGNISRQVYDKYIDERGKGCIIFELTDSPLDTHAEELFAPGSFRKVEPLKKRMNKVQSLFETLLNKEKVIDVLLEVNYLYASGIESTILIKATDFCERMIQIYQQNDNFLPVLRFKILK